MNIDTETTDGIKTEVATIRYMAETTAKGIAVSAAPLLSELQMQLLHRFKHYGLNEKEMSDVECVLEDTISEALGDIGDAVMKQLDVFIHDSLDDVLYRLKKEAEEREESGYNYEAQKRDDYDFLCRDNCK